MKLIIFGAGNFYKNRKRKLESWTNIEIVAFIDNNSTLWGEMIDGFPIMPLAEISQVLYDKILIMSLYVQEIYEQLIESGIKRQKIQFWEPFCAEMVSGRHELVYGEYIQEKRRRSLLIISTSLHYDGGSMVAVYAALALQKRGYFVVLAVPGGDKALIEEIGREGVTLVLCPSLPYIYSGEAEWLRQFDMVLVNVFQMIHSACTASSIRPTLWWIHEAITIMEAVISKPWNEIDEKKFDNINIYAVSEIPKKNFNSLYSGRIQKILPYGIPDKYLPYREKIAEHSKVVFAVIGVVCERKAQNVFCKAVERMTCRNQAEFLIIGSCGDNSFCNEVIQMTTSIDSMKMTGMLTREEMYRMFPQIDVVVCTSREDPLPIVLTEGMMFGKVCITTKGAGTVDYIKDGENGFVVSVEDVDALKEKMEWVIHNREKLETIGRNARKTYEKYFTMDVFGENLEKALLQTEKKWHEQAEVG